MSVPEGFSLYVPDSPALKQFEPMYELKKTDGTSVFGLYVQHHHLNLLGVAHGGILLMLADAAMGHSLRQVAGFPIVTVSLNANFLESVNLGVWLESHIKVDRIGQRLVFAECELRVKEKVVMTSTGVFARIKKR